MRRSTASVAHTGPHKCKYCTNGEADAERQPDVVCARPTQRLGTQEVARVAVNAGTSDAITTLMNDYVADMWQRLVELNRLEDQFEASQTRPNDSLEDEALILSLRANISLSALVHHDRLRARGRTSVAEVRHGVCAGCHMGLPMGTAAAVKHPSTLLKCENCGRFIFLAEDELVAAPAPEPAKKPDAPRRPSKKLSEVR